MVSSSSLLTSATDPSNRKFHFKKALIVTKLSRYEFEQHKNSKLTNVQLEKLLRDRGTDYDLLLYYHQLHKDFERKVADSFRGFGIDVKLVNRLVHKCKVSAYLSMHIWFSFKPNRFDAIRSHISSRAHHVCTFDYYTPEL